jgi:AAA domain, putative AbiEii toxin, Type IV TA system
MFTSLNFSNFRGFERLDLEGLKRVNLVVGRNNAGKTSLLEGIAIVSDPERFNELPQMFRPHAGDARKRYFRWLFRDQESLQAATLTGVGAGIQTEVAFRQNTNDQQPPAPGMQPVMNLQNATLWRRPSQRKLTSRVVPVQHHSPEQLVKLFAAAVKRKGGEERIEGLLREVDPRIRKVRVEPADDGNHLLVDLGLSEMLPVSQVGQGIYRLIAIFSELIGEKPDVCIIDEIENGIHHSMLKQVWTGLAAAAETLGVQVFATTHSEECIEAAHAAFSKREAYDFSIIQLFRVEGAVQGRVLDRKHIEAAMAGEIDLR